MPHVRQWYAIPSQFRWRDDQGQVHHRTQAEGGEQGDALMPALFCLALHPALQRIKALLPQDATIIAYLDDIYIICDGSDTAEILQQSDTVLGQLCHIDVNVGKLAAWSKTVGPCPRGLATCGPGVWKSDQPEHLRGIDILGTPFGSDAYIAQHGTELA